MNIYTTLSYLHSQTISSTIALFQFENLGVRYFSLKMLNTKKKQVSTPTLVESVISIWPRSLPLMLKLQNRPLS